MSLSKSLRSSSKICKVNNQVVLESLPTITNFKNTKLHILKEVVVVVYHVQERNSVSFDDAIKNVRDFLIEHWKQRNIYTKSDTAVFKSLKKYVEQYRKYSRTEASRLMRNGKETADKIVEPRKSGSTLTNAADSTTRKTVGSFAPAGIHINREDYLPLPTLPIASETTKNISEGIETDFKILEAASKHSAETLYSCVHVHMTDSTAFFYLPAVFLEKKKIKIANRCLIIFFAHRDHITYHLF